MTNAEPFSLTATEPGLDVNPKSLEKVTVPVWGIKVVRESVVKYTHCCRLTGKSEVVAACTALGIQDEATECLYVLSLNTKNRIVGVTLASKGTLNASLIHPREVFRAAILNNSHAVILVHNHPSGDVEPSNADKQVTKVIADAGKIIGIELLDHVIMGTDSASFSFRERSLI